MGSGILIFLSISTYLILTFSVMREVVGIKGVVVNEGASSVWLLAGFLILIIFLVVIGNNLFSFVVEVRGFV